MTEMAPARHRRSPAAALGPTRLTAESALLGLVVGLAVVAPWTRSGYLLLLDWVAGPHQTITPGLYGLDPAALDALPYRLLTQAVRAAVGAGATSWLMILVFFAAAAAGVSTLAGGGRWRRHVAALFVCVNPFVIERLQVGHVPFLLSVAVLCPLLASALRARRQERWFAVRPACWYALAVSIGPHAAWLGGAGLLAVALLPRPRLRDLFRTMTTVAAAGCVYAYAAAVLTSAILTVTVSADDLEAYATHAGPAGLLATVATLRGFWRGASDSSPQLELSLVPATVLVLAAAAGLARLCRRDRTAGVPLAVLTGAGLLLGLGIRGPLEAAYRLAFDTLPLFPVMREQQKWVSLAMIGYAVGAGMAAEAVAAGLRRDRPVRCAAAAGGLLALAGTLTVVGSSLVWGLGGAVRVHDYPAAWYAADRVMGTGTEAVLFLPWHQYQPFVFTDGRTVGTPATAFFRRPVIGSDAAELGPVRTNSPSLRMAYLDRVIAQGGPGGRFGRLVAPLGIRYVVLARDRDAATYAWLDRQRDLKLVMRAGDLDLYRVTVTGTGRVVGARGGDYDRTVGWAAAGDLGTEAVLPGGTDREPFPATGTGAIRRLSSTSWRVDAGAAGWVVLPEEWSPGWSADGRATRPTLAGTVAVDAGGAAVTVRYAPWSRLRLGLAGSLLSLAVLFAAGLVEHRRELRRPRGFRGGSGRRRAGPRS